MSALQSLNKVTAKYSAQDKELLLRNLSPDSLKLIKKSEPLIKVNIIES